MNEDMKAGAMIALQGVNEEIETILKVLRRNGIETPIGFPSLQGYVEDRMRELGIKDTK